MLVMLIQSVGSQLPPPYKHYLATTLPSLPSCLNLSSDAPISSNSYVSFLLSRWLIVSLCHGIPHHLVLPLPPPLVFLKSLQYVSHLRFVLLGCTYWQIYVDRRNVGCRIQIHMSICKFLLSQRLHAPLYISSFLSHTYALPILLQLIHSHSTLIFEGCLPFSPLWRMNGLVSGAILCPSRRSGVCAASHWSSKWAGNGAGEPGC